MGNNKRTRKNAPHNTAQNASTKNKNKKKIELAHIMKYDQDSSISFDDDEDSSTSQEDDSEDWGADIKKKHERS